MSENLTTNVELDSTANGTVSFATDVVATIAGLAATEVEGVAAMINNGNMGLVDMLRKNQGNRPLTRGVKVDINGNQVIVQLNVTVDYGSPVPAVAREIQDNVKKAIETMTGLEVPEINIYVQGISFEKENRAAAELEQKQRAALTAQKVERLGRGDEAKAEDKSEPAAEAEEQVDSEKRRMFHKGGFALRHREDEKTDGVAPEEDKPEQEAEAHHAEAAHETADDEPAPENSADAEVAEEPSEADEADEPDEPVCDGHCDTCTLECDAAGKPDAVEADPDIAEADEGQGAADEDGKDGRAE